MTRRYRQDYERSTDRQISCIDFGTKPTAGTTTPAMNFHWYGSGSGARIYTEDLFMQAYLSDICLGGSMLQLPACFRPPHQ